MWFRGGILLGLIDLGLNSSSDFSSGPQFLHLSNGKRLVLRVIKNVSSASEGYVIFILLLA